MRRGALAAVAAAAVLSGCGGSSSDTGIVTDSELADGLAQAAQRSFDDRGLFGTRVGQGGAICHGGQVRWTCTLDVTLSERLTDRRTYAVVLRRRCWTARQTGTDVGETGRPARPSRPGILRGCL
jgi:hypothetical protein